MNTHGKIRIGLDGNRAPVLESARAMNTPVLVSANSLWNDRSKRFRSFSHLEGMDVALDSGGFVAMRLYGRFRFDVATYVEFASRMRPTWWASMDFCCEPEVVEGRAGMWDRQLATAMYFRACYDASRDAGISPPMPVIQGWKPSDYCFSARLLKDAVHWDLWPELIGVGSVCRRALDGPAGLLKIVARLDAVLPHRFKFHLFGVKGAAVKRLAEHPRFGSMDSIAYDAGNRRENIKESKRMPRTNAVRADAMVEWLSKQRKRAVIKQPNLF